MKYISMITKVKNTLKGRRKKRVIRTMRLAGLIKGVLLLVLILSWLHWLLFSVIFFLIIITWMVIVLLSTRKNIIISCAEWLDRPLDNYHIPIYARRFYIYGNEGMFYEVDTVAVIPSLYTLFYIIHMSEDSFHFSTIFPAFIIAAIIGVILYFGINIIAKTLPEKMI